MTVRPSPCRPVWPRGDRGAASTQLVLLLPVMLLAIGMLVVGARIALAGQRINGVAGTAARAASLDFTAGAAQADATAAAQTALTSDDLHCTRVTVDVDTSGFSAPTGSPATVTVTVGCTVDLSDIGVAGLPGSRTLTDTGTSPLDVGRNQP